MSSVFCEKALANRHAFVTGGSSGICLRIAEVFARYGARLSLLGRKQEKLDAAVAGIAGNGYKALGYAADVRNYEALATALQSAREASGEIDILICGAAGNFPAPALGMSANGFKAVMDIDVLGTFNTCRAAFQHLKRPGASILNISANHATQPYPWQSHVCAAKAGVDMLTRTLALEWGPEGVRVNSLAPGPVDDTEGMRRLAPDPTSRDRLMRGVPLRRLATKDDIAHYALFLASDAASYVTGSVCLCDGGTGLIGVAGLGF